MRADEPTDPNARPFMALAMVLGGLALAYAATLTAWFIADDFWFLAAAEHGSFASYAASVLDPREIGSAYELDRYRPLYPLLWRTQYELFGTNAAWYHASVLATHIACVFVVALIFQRLLSPTPAAFACVIFALHPIYADAITWVSGANRVYAALPFFAAALCFMHAQDRTLLRFAWLGVAFALHFVAILLHPSAIVFVGIAAFYIALYTPRQELRSFGPWLQLSPFVAFAAFMFGVQWYVRDLVPAGEAYKFGFHQYSNYAWYMAVTLVPLAHYNPFEGPPDAVRIAQLAASAAMILAVPALIATGRMPRAGLFAFGWFTLALLPDSTLLLSRFGRALYLAGPAMAILLVLLGEQLLSLVPSLRRRGAASAWLPSAALAGLAMILAVICFTQTNNLIDQSHENERFAQTLRDANLDVGTGDHLLIVDPPRDLTILGPTYVDSIAQIYYPGVSVSLARGSNVETPPGATVFVYRQLD